MWTCVDLHAGGVRARGRVCMCVCVRSLGLEGQSEQDKVVQYAQSTSCSTEVLTSVKR